MLSDEFFQRWGDVRKGTRSLAELMPDDKLDFKPQDDMMSLGELAAHIISAFYFLFRRRLGQKVEIPQIVKSREPMNGKTFGELLDSTDALFQELLKELNPEELGYVLHSNEGESWSREYFLWYIANHETHHRAQLKLYLKLLGVKT